MRVAILQSNYIPWKGYFDFIHSVDTFIFYDDADYTKRSWRNRNRIKTPHGSRWLTIPLGSIKFGTPMDTVRLPTHDWQEQHLERITANYSPAPHFKNVTQLLSEIYCNTRWELLSELNQYAIRLISSFLGIEKTTFLNSRSLNVPARAEQKLINICKAVGATEYLTGPNTRAYIKEESWAAAGIELHWKHYEYPPYEQLYAPYDPAVTILDLLFMKGADAGHYIWGDDG